MWLLNLSEYLAILVLAVVCRYHSCVGLLFSSSFLIFKKSLLRKQGYRKGESFQIVKYTILEEKGKYFQSQQVYSK